MPLRPLDVGEILDGAVRLVRRNARAAFGVSVPFAIVRTAIVAAVQLAVYHESTGSVPQELTLLLVSGVLGTVLTGLLAPVFAGDLAGAAERRPVARMTVALALLAGLVGVTEEVGLVVLVVGGAWLWGVWAVAAPVMTIERVGVRRALGRSVELVRTAFWRTWGIRALRWVLTGVLGLFLSLPFTLLATALAGVDVFDQAAKGIGHPALYVTLLAVGRLISVSVTSPISAAVDTLLYTDLRMRHEGMDLVLALPTRTDQPPVTAW